MMSVACIFFTARFWVSYSRACSPKCEEDSISRFKFLLNTRAFRYFNDSEREKCLIKKDFYLFENELYSFCVVEY